MKQYELAYLENKIKAKEKSVCEDSENQKYRRRTTVHDKCEFCEQIYQDRSEI